MLLLQRCTITYTAMEEMTALIRRSGCDAHTHTHTQRAQNVNAPERMKDGVGLFFHPSRVFRLINRTVSSVIEGAQAHIMR